MAGLVAQNFGIAVMPEIPILRQLGVDVLSIRNQHEKRFVYMAWRKDAYQTPMVHRLYRVCEAARAVKNTRCPPPERWNETLYLRRGNLPSL